MEVSGRIRKAIKSEERQVKNIKGKARNYQASLCKKSPRISFQSHRVKAIGFWSISPKWEF